MTSLFCLQCPLLHKSQFLGQTHMFNTVKKPPSFTIHRTPSTFYLSAKFDLYQILGGRGLLNGEQGVERELKRNIQDQTSDPEADAAKDKTNSDGNSMPTAEVIPESGFEKELLGLTGGFPGGEKGLKQFIEKNPPPKKSAAADSGILIEFPSSKKPKAPQLPLLMPGMIAIVKNPNNPFYMYCGIVQRITDGRAGVLFEGGNWDRLVTFRLDELERREKGPPMKNPKSCVLEPLLEKES